MFVFKKIPNNTIMCKMKRKSMEWLVDFVKEIFHAHLGTNICRMYVIWHYVECFTYVI